VTVSVRHDRDELAGGKTEPDVHVPREARSLVDDHQLLAVSREGGETGGEGAIHLVVDRPVGNDDA
jgi:hypothetical protein